MADDKEKKVMTTYDPYNVKNYNPFFYPVPIPSTDSITNLICVKIARAWLPLVRGALQTILWKDVYIGTTQEQEQATLEASRLLSFLSYEDRCMLLFRNKPTDPCVVQTSEDGVTWLDGFSLNACVTPAVTNIFRFNETTYHYEYSGDGGQTWNDATDIDPRFTQAQEDPPTGANDLCIAAENTRDHIIQLLSDIWALIQTIGTVAAIVAVILTTLGQSWAFLLVYNPPALWAIAGILLSVIGSQFDDIFTQAFKDDLLCWLYNAYQLSELGQENWVTIEVFDYMIARLRADGSVAANITELLLSLGGAVILSESATEGGSTGDVCANCLGWSHHFLSGDGAIDFDSVALGSYNGAADRYEQVFEVSQFRMSVQVNVTFASPVLITRLRATIDSLIHDPFSPRNNKIYWIDSLAVLHEVASQPITNTGIYNLDSGIIAVAAHGLVFEFFGRHAGNQTDHHWFTSCTIDGEDFDPFPP